MSFHFTEKQRNMRRSTQPTSAVFLQGLKDDPRMGGTRQFGENAHPELTLTGLGDEMLGFSDKFTRGLGDDQIFAFTKAIVQKANTTKGMSYENRVEMLTNLFVLGFQTRWCRGGKGEKLVAYKLMALLHTKYPQVVKACLALLPQFGYWKDPLLFLMEMKKGTSGAAGNLLDAPTYAEAVRRTPMTSSEAYRGMVEHVADLFADQLREDTAALDLYEEEKRNEKANKAKAFGSEKVLAIIGEFAPEMTRTHIRCPMTFCAKFAPSTAKEHDKAIGILKRSAPPDSKDPKHFEGIASLIARLLFPEIKKTQEREKAYRLYLKRLRDALDVPEVKMCANRWDEIQFTGLNKVTSMCVTRCRRAFANEQKKGPKPGSFEAETGNRHPNDIKRIECRKHFLEAAKKGKIAGAQASLPGLTKQAAEVAMNAENEAMRDVVNGQWKSLRTSIVAMINKRREMLADGRICLCGRDHGDTKDGPQLSVFVQRDGVTHVINLYPNASVGCLRQNCVKVFAGEGGKMFHVGAELTSDETLLADAGVGAETVVNYVGSLRPSTQVDFDVGKTVVMADVSGSMSGDPMDLAVGLGILVSEIAHPAWRNVVMTFDSNPQWHQLLPRDTFVEKVNSLRRAPWGGSTNFEAAMTLIVDMIRLHKLPTDQWPQSLLIVSDMQFDQARSDYGYGYGHHRGHGGARWSVAYERIKETFASLGQELWGVPALPPKIIFWNARSNTTGYPANSTDEGVALLSGSSPALLKFVLSGEMTRKMTPMDMLAKQLYDSGLNPVRELLGHFIDELSVGFIEKPAPKEAPNEKKKKKSHTDRDTDRHTDRDMEKEFDELQRKMAELGKRIAEKKKGEPESA